MHTEALNLIYQLPKIEDRSPTLLEIGGFPHYENIISNYLAFYFNPAEKHGLKDTLLKAWCKTLGISTEVAFNSIDIRREVTTDSKTRIDLLISTPDLVFCIENKIFHHAQNNPLSEYQEYVEIHYPSQQQYFTILSLDDIPGFYLENSDFENILYSDFISNLRELLPPTDSLRHPQLKLLFLKELLQTIQNLISRRTMQKEALQLIRDNFSAIQRFNSHLTDIQKDMDRRILGVKEVIAKANFPIQYSQVWLSGNEEARKDIKAVLFYTLDEDTGIELKIRLTPKGWTTELWKYTQNPTISVAIAKNSDASSLTQEESFQLKKKPDDYFCDSFFIKEQVRQLLAKAGIFTNT